MVDMDSDLVLAPIEDTLEEGEVHVEEESEEDAPRLRLAPNVVSPQQGEDRRPQDMSLSIQIMVQAMRHGTWHRAATCKINSRVPGANCWYGLLLHHQRGCAKTSSFG